MPILTYNSKKYEIDGLGFLLDSDKWDEGFAEGMAVGVRITQKLTKEHWDVIKFIRNTFKDDRHCPTVYETSKAIGLGLKELRNLFPTGYLRGACKLAGITYKNVPPPVSTTADSVEELRLDVDGKVYLVDCHGFLIDSKSWDENYAEYIASKSSIPDGILTDKHWQIIRYLRRRFNEHNDVANVYEVCDANNIDLIELEKLFPDGYHRGAVKIAGLRVR